MTRKNTFSQKVQKIPSKIYSKILELMPICCVDCIFTSKGKVYLFKRAYEPVKGKWWLVGGRLLKGELLEDAVRRKVKEEIGVDVRIVKQVGVYEVFLEKNRFTKKPTKIATHSVAVCYVVEPILENFKIKLNKEYTEFKTISKQGPSIYPYVKLILKDSGVIK